LVDIQVSKATESHLHVKAELHILRELSEYFTFFTPAYQHSPKFKSGYWDGKIRLFSGQDHTLYLGLLEKVVEFANDRGYSIELEPDLIGTDEFSMHEAAEYAKSLNIHIGGVKIEVQDYQIAALCYAIRNHRQFFLIPTGAGKTVCDYLICRYLIDHGLKGLIVCPDKGLVGQLYQDFLDYSSHNGWDVDANLHLVYQGQLKDSDKPIICTTFQSANLRDDPYFEQFDFLIGEEADTFKAKTLKRIGEKLINARYRVGLTGSLDGKKVHELVLTGLFGPIKTLTTIKELQDRGRLSGLRIKCIILRHPAKIINAMTSKIRKKWSWPNEREFINNCPKFHRFAANLALSMKQSTLVLFEDIELGEAIFKVLEATAGDRPIYYVDGPSKGDFKDEITYRNWVRAEMERHPNAIVVASRVFVRGININNIHNLIRVSLNKAKASTMQGIGRGLRALVGKQFLTMYELVHDLRYKSWENHQIKHLQERLMIYNEEGFDVKMYNVDLVY
jgi:superfamily II DNA or RNA helicase